jgi:hypothetical protein
MEIVLPAVPSPGIMSLMVGLVMGIVVVITEVVGTRMVSRVDIRVVGDGVPGGVMLVHPPISKNPIIRIAGKWFIVLFVIRRWIYLYLA